MTPAFPTSISLAPRPMKIKRIFLEMVDELPEAG
jgi:hypothetical protein